MATTERAPSAAGFRTALLAQLARVPEGHVVTYGQLALLAGAPGRARQAGFVLSGLAGDRAEPDLPWHRVINAQGRVSTDRLGFGDLQRQLLMAEGVLFDASGRCDLARHRWWPQEQGPHEHQHGEPAIKTRRAGSVDHAAPSSSEPEGG